MGFATSPGGFEFCFLTQPGRDPDTWPVVWHDYADYGDTRWTEFRQGFEAFLYDLIRGEIPEEITGESHGYTEFLPVEPDTRHHHVEPPDTGPGAVVGRGRP